MYPAALRTSGICLRQAGFPFDEAQNLGFYSQLFLAKALGVQQVTQAIQLDMISNNVQSVMDADELCPEKSTLLGPCKVIPQEYPNVTCQQHRCVA